MTDVTLSRGSDSVTFPLDVPGGELPITWVVSKPQQKIENVSQLNPRARDNFQSLRTFTLSGTIYGPNTYQKARSLVNNLIKPHGGGTQLQIDLSNFSGLGTYNVAPVSDNAIELEYLPGGRNLVNVSLNLTQVDSVIAGQGSQTPTFSAPVPGNGGSITLTHPDGDNLTLTNDLRVTRSVGRPNSEVSVYPDEVRYFDKIRSASDVFEIRGEIQAGSAATDAVTLIEDILANPLGRDTMTLDFNNNLYGLPSFDVVPTGGQAGKMSITSGEGNVRTIGPLTLRVVQ